MQIFLAFQSILIFFVCVNLYAADIAVVTIASGEGYYLKVEKGIITKKEYCERHGYDFICLNKQLDPLRPHAWSKILLIQQILNQYEWVFWTDADSLIMNPNIKLESFVDQGYSLIISPGVSSPFCTGEFLIKNCPWSFSLLESIYSREDLIFHHLWEQQAFTEIAEQNNAVMQQIKVLPQKSLNSYSPFQPSAKEAHHLYSPGDFIIHFAGLRGNKFLKNLMEFYYSQRITNEHTISEILLNRNSSSSFPPKKVIDQLKKDYIDWRDPIQVFKIKAKILQKALEDDKLKKSFEL